MRKRMVIDSVDSLPGDLIVGVSHGSDSMMSWKSSRMLVVDNGEVLISDNYSVSFFSEDVKLVLMLSDGHVLSLVRRPGAVRYDVIRINYQEISETGLPLPSRGKGKTTCEPSAIAR